jgi:hypothetical protein
MVLNSVFISEYFFERGRKSFVFVLIGRSVLIVCEVNAKTIATTS